jgi:hypothetical protein
VLALGASIVPSIDVLMGIAAVGRLLTVGTPLRVAACLQGVPVFNFKPMGEAIIHIVVALDNVGVRQGSVSGITRRTGDWNKWGNTPANASSEEVLSCSRVYVGHVVAMATLTRCSFPSATSTSTPYTSTPLPPLLKVTNCRDVKLCGRGERRCLPGVRARLVSGSVGICHHLHHCLLV